MNVRTPRHLLIGDEQDVALLRMVLASFSQDAVGELMLELPGTECPPIPAPVGLSLRGLPRDPGAPPGVRACVALRAWIDEWVLDEHASAEGHAIFVGMAGNPFVERWCEAMLECHPHLHLHRPWRDPAAHQVSRRAR